MSQARKFRVGDIVRHRKYGIGKITQIFTAAQQKGWLDPEDRAFPYLVEYYEPLTEVKCEQHCRRELELVKW